MFLGTPCFSEKPADGRFYFGGILRVFTENAAAALRVRFIKL